MVAARTLDSDVVLVLIPDEGIGFAVVKLSPVAMNVEMLIEG